MLFQNDRLVVRSNHYVEGQVAASKPPSEAKVAWASLSLPLASQHVLPTLLSPLYPAKPCLLGQSSAPGYEVWHVEIL